MSPRSKIQQTLPENCSVPIEHSSFYKVNSALLGTQQKLFVSAKDILEELQVTSFDGVEVSRAVKAVEAIKRRNVTLK